jgi:hypothetical protein
MSLTVRITKARADRHSLHPDHDSSEMDEAFEVDCPAFIAGGETAEVLEAIKTPLDTISLFVSDLRACRKFLRLMVY